MNKQLIDHYREFLKDSIRQKIDFSQTDQIRRVPPPPIQKPIPEGAETIPLPRIDKAKSAGSIELWSAIAQRESYRFYSEEPLNFDELSMLLWATQGVRLKLDAGHALRTAPSAGCRHAFETYLCVLNVEGLEQGIYRYLPLEHALLFSHALEQLESRIIHATLGQRFTGDAAVTFVWTALPYRMEWRYSLAAHKVIALDAGHVCQNLYLACEAIAAGTCAIAAYHQDRMDKLIDVDGKEEFTIYLAPVGKKA
ncbi:MAG TPA: SagB/ThcOx family dehydrogenase [Chlorobaculum parvum]|uniref:SagB/ThcOx family dehydrogenase n=2 Tax=Chlorobaculum parvum TaxID=274539 RepID=A0A7C5HFG4_9CHLB|nr:SagB/ThcOx family dehydrogenase [Chlorobaculum parvum]